MTNNDLKRSDFVDPTFQALAELAEGREDVTVTNWDIYPRACEILGVAEEDCGHQASTGKLMTHFWIARALRDLRDKRQWIESGGRAKWSLTPKGVQAYLRLTEKDRPAPEPAEDEESPVNTFEEDPYLTELAISLTPCFGFYSEEEKTCQGCALAGSCFQKRQEELARLARELDEDREVEAILARTNHLPKLDGRLLGTQMVTPTNEVCVHCETTIKKGTQCVWVGNPEDKIGVYHLWCLNQL